MSSKNFVFFVLCALLLGASGGAASAEDTARGEVLFTLCTQCHGADGGGMRLALAPAIAGMDQWYVENQLKLFRSGGRGGHPDDVAGMRMRPMSMSLRSEDDVTAVAAYVASLPVQRPEPEVAGGDATRGKAIYAPCTACHAADGSGNKALNGPSLTKTSDWYLLTQLANYKSGVRGSNPKDTNGALMAAMAGTIQNEQAMKDLIAYIETLGR